MAAPMQRQNTANSLVSVPENLTRAKEYVDSSIVVKKDTWSPTFHFTVKSMTSIFHKHKDDLPMARKVIAGMSLPRPLHVQITKCYIPRRDDIPMEHMKPELKTGNIKAEWVELYSSSKHTPQSAAAGNPQRVIIYVHGGNYFMGSRKTHRSVTWRLATYANARVLSLDYRLAPEHHFPCAQYDLLSAYLWLIDPPAGAAHGAFKPEQIVFAGDSAGGNLSVTTALWMRDYIPSPTNSPTSLKFPLPAGLALLSPWLDMTHSTPSFTLNGAHDYLPHHSNDTTHLTHSEEQSHYYVPTDTLLTHPYVSPLFSAPLKDKPMPKTLIQVGTAERLRDESVAYYLRHESAAIRLEMWEDMVHAFHLFAPGEPISRAAVRKIAEFVVGVTPKLESDAENLHADFKRRKFEGGAFMVENKKGWKGSKWEGAEKFLEEEWEKVGGMSEGYVEACRLGDVMAAEVVQKAATIEAAPEAAPEVAAVVVEEKVIEKAVAVEESKVPAVEPVAESSTSVEPIPSTEKQPTASEPLKPVSIKEKDEHNSDAQETPSEQSEQPPASVLAVVA
ncbi:hypothetical protein HDV05_000999 [Chytridiales sp. JEL 0842]|nr:hypothetical protein HDV05_000999 [Chytridiales sp. JEL 0842]